MEKTKVGVIGCGNISRIYIQNLKAFDQIELTALADLDLEKARARADEFGVAKACSPEELLADPAIEIIVNLTIPAAHAEVCLRALEAGKHVYTEKPLAITLEDGRRIVDTAARRGLRVAVAPETFMGGGLQTCRKLIDDGVIGTPVAAGAFMVERGHEHWHPDPEFYYQRGGGPMYDMGPYYLTALVHLLGPVRRIAGSARISYPERTIESAAKYGQKIKVEVPTHVTGTLEFASGAIGTMIMSFDAMGGSELPRIEIYGSKGTLSVPDPNKFGGPVMLRLAGEKEFREVPLTHGRIDNNRGIGVADLAGAIREGRSHRASGTMALHVLEAMHGFHESAETGRHYAMTTSCERPHPMPALSES